MGTTPIYTGQSIIPTWIYQQVLLHKICIFFVCSPKTPSSSLHKSVMKMFISHITPVKSEFWKHTMKNKTLWTYFDSKSLMKNYSSSLNNIKMIETLCEKSIEPGCWCAQCGSSVSTLPKSWMRPNAYATLFLQLLDHQLTTSGICRLAKIRGKRACTGLFCN